MPCHDALPTGDATSVFYCKASCRLNHLPSVCLGLATTDRRADRPPCRRPYVTVDPVPLHRRLRLPRAGTTAPAKALVLSCLVLAAARAAGMYTCLFAEPCRRRTMPVSAGDLDARAPPKLTRHWCAVSISRPWIVMCSASSWRPDSAALRCDGSSQLPQLGPLALGEPCHRGRREWSPLCQLDWAAQDKTWRRSPCSCVSVASTRETLRLWTAII